MTAFFVFDEHETLVAERIYFDQLTALRQLLGSLDRRKPRHLLLLAGAVLGMLRMAGSAPEPRLTTTTSPELT
jgi:hypothetical protein